MKRSIMQGKITFGMAVAVFACFATASFDLASADSPKPNIVYILADDLGYGELGAYGQEMIETPNIDALAGNGMRFMQHYSGSPVCAPSRCTLLTGKHTGHAYIRGNDEWKSRGDVWDYAKMVENPYLEGQRPLPDSISTIGNLLQKSGYRTAIVGKWGLGGPMTDGIPTNRGFDFFFGYNCQRQAHNYYPRHLWRNEEKVWLDNEIVQPGTGLPEGADPYDPDSYSLFRQKEYAPELMLDEALGFLERSRNDSFFLYFASPLPHVALQIPEEYVEAYIKKFGEEEPFTDPEKYFPTRYPHATYAAMISYLDRQVGKIVEKLKEMGVYENTLILFSSDNGPANNAGADPVHFDSAAPFKSERGWGKGNVREGGIRVPMIASWEGKIEAGSKSDHISAFWDVMPTLSGVAGYQVPNNTDGISFLPTLLGQNDQKTHEFLYWEYPSKGGQQAVRMDSWKGIRDNLFEGDLSIALYNLEKDPREQNDVSAEHPDVVQQIERIMEREHTVPELEAFRIEALGDS